MGMSGSVKARGKTLPVVETFHSIQGEGVWMGRSAFFIRLAGCDVGCPWCDTKHSWPMERHPQRAVSDLVSEAITAEPVMVVITGGEPLMHNLGGLTLALHGAGLRVHVETSGSYPLSGEFDWISLSPKRYKPPLETIYGKVNELKVVVGDPLDIIWAETTAQKISSEVVKLLQPRWNSEEGEQMVFKYVLSHPEWRLGLQTHKFLGVR
ncbi:MAG: 7-carboxy-7-deazaguanine synthase QueE [Cyanobacteria bacterium P01_D01_bin.105]